MTEDQAFEKMAREIQPLYLYSEKTLAGFVRETVARCTPEVRELAAKRLQRAMLSGDDELRMLWRRSKALAHPTSETVRETAKAFVAALRDPMIISET